MEDAGICLPFLSPVVCPSEKVGSAGGIGTPRLIEHNNFAPLQLDNSVWLVCGKDCYHKGVDVKILSQLLGHADVNITYNIYVHLYGDGFDEMYSALVSEK